MDICLERLKETCGTMKHDIRSLTPAVLQSNRRLPLPQKPLKLLLNCSVLECREENSGKN